jgi:competence protein ComEC
VSNLRSWIVRQLDAERGRWMLWLLVAMGLGIAVYFELPSEPALWIGPAIAIAALVAALFAPSGSFARALAIGAAASAVGLGLVAWRTASAIARVGFRSEPLPAMRWWRRVESGPCSPCANLEAEHVRP